MDSTLEQFHDLDFYRRHFMDASLWRPYVRRACQQHGLGCKDVRGALPGTYPTFIVDDRWVVKFFGRLFSGGTDFDVELHASRLLVPGCGIPAPALVAEGALFTDTTDWRWPYLIFEYLPGTSLGEVREQVGWEDKLRIAREMGEILRRLHRLPLDDDPVFRPTWEDYTHLLENQRHACLEKCRTWQDFPPHLADQVAGFLLPVEAQIDFDQAPHLIHADLTADHLLGRLEEGRWTTLGLIDFGDAMVGDIYYELAALHIDLFHCDQRLLYAFLEAYGFNEELRQSLPIRAMNAALLHRFAEFIFLYLFMLQPGLREARSLEELAFNLWVGRAEPSH
jgi:hygromycin-B 7''-O-kinase